MDPEESATSGVPTDPGFYKELLDHMSDGVYFVDRQRRILYWNEGAYRLTGYRADELLGRHCQDDILCHIDGDGKRLCQDSCPLSASIGDGAPHEANVFLRHKLGRRVPVNVRVQPMRDASGSVIGAIEIFSDDSAQTEARRKAEAMRRMAFMDHLTQLPNRRFLDLSIQAAHNEFQLHEVPFAVLVIDLDGFKAVNDKWGHAYGDRVLQEVARTLNGSLRPSDTVGRWGGDEFLAIVRHVDIHNLRKLAERCVTIAGQTAVPGADGRRFSISISVGAALAVAAETPAELLQRADRLMYKCKSAGGASSAVE